MQQVEFEQKKIKKVERIENLMEDIGIAFVAMSRDEPLEQRTFDPAIGTTISNNSDAVLYHNGDIQIFYDGDGTERFFISTGNDTMIITKPFAFEDDEGCNELISELARVCKQFNL